MWFGDEKEHHKSDLSILVDYRDADEVSIPAALLSAEGWVFDTDAPQPADAA
jgi:hypothetical protein